MINNRMKVNIKSHLECPVGQTTETGSPPIACVQRSRCGICLHVIEEVLNLCECKFLLSAL